MGKTTNIWMIECFGLASLNPKNSEIAYGTEFCLSTLLSSNNNDRERLPRANDYVKVLSALSIEIQKERQKFFETKEQEKNAITDLLIQTSFVRHYHIGRELLIEAAFIYKRHNRWLKDHLGFDIDQLMTFTLKIFEILRERFPAGVFDEPPDPNHFFWANGWIRFEEYPLILLPSKITLRSWGSALNFAIKDLVDSISEETSKAILRTFSRPVGQFPPQISFADACSLTRHPFIAIDSESFILPIPFLLPTAILENLELLIQEDRTYYEKVLNERGSISEDRLESLLRPVFGPAFIFRNQLNPKGKELSDFIVWNGEQLIVFESKYLGRTVWEGSIERYGAKILKRMEQAHDQLGGALRVLHDSKVTLEWTNVSGGTAQFECHKKSEIHLLAVLTEEVRPSLLSSQGKSLESIHDRYVHYFSIRDLAHLLRFLPSIPDFCHYLRGREEALKTGKFFINFEEDMLGWYLDHGKSFAIDRVIKEGNPDYLSFPCYWEDMVLKHKETLTRRFLADQVSYWVDHVLKQLAPRHGPDTPFIKELGKLDRLARRMLGEIATRKALQAAKENRPVWSLGRPGSLDTYFIVLFVPKEWTRDTRKKLLEDLLLAGLVKTGATRIVGIASEAADSEVQSYDVGYLEGPIDIDAGMREAAKKYFGTQYHVNVKEYPD